MNEVPKLYYLFDPMCSWCWGYEPTWQKLQSALGKSVQLEYKVGGLAPDSDQPMAKKMQEFLQATWRKIAKQLGTEFNFDFWTMCQPRRSTYPACRAVIAARVFNKEHQMINAIQRAYYLEAKNPSNIEVLIELAGDLNIEEQKFTSIMHSEELQLKLEAEIFFTKSLPIQGYPSLVLKCKNIYYSIPINYHDVQESSQYIKALIRDI